VEEARNRESGMNLADVFGGDHATSDDRGNLLSRARSDRFDPAMRHPDAEDIAVQHARQEHGVGISARPVTCRAHPIRASELPTCPPATVVAICHFREPLAARGSFLHGTAECRRGS